MKKLFLLAVGLAMTLTACQKDEGLVSDVATTSSFTVTIPQSGVQTRAVTDAFGTGTSVKAGADPMVSTRKARIAKLLSLLRSKISAAPGPGLALTITCRFSG